MIWDGSRYFTESFLVNSTDNINKTQRDIVQPSKGFISARTYSEENATGGCALLAPDVNFIPDLQNTLCGTEMLFEKRTE
jgi:hypothetical protein